MTGWRRTIYLLAGILFGAFLLWLLLRQIPVAEVVAAMSAINSVSIACGIALYAAALLIRSKRWQILLEAIGPVRYQGVLGVLIIGYALNNLLPARVGELIRAERAKAQFGFSWSTSLGTIALERLCDGIAVLLMLACGLIFLPANAGSVVQLNLALFLGVCLFGTLAVVLWFLTGSRRFRILSRFPFVAQRAEKFREGLLVLRSKTMVRVVAWSVIVWIADCASVWFVLNAVGVALSPTQLLLAIGAISLSTLLPSAPGYIGTMQLAYVLSVNAFGYASALGFAAATAAQLFILAPFTAIGIALMLINHIGLTINASDQPDPRRSATEQDRTS